MIAMGSNLRLRLLAALVMVPAALAALLLLSPAWFALAAALVMALGAWEWAALAGRPSPRERGVYAAGTFILMLSLLFLAPSPGAALVSCAIGVLWWGLALLWIVGTQRGRYALRPAGIWTHRLCGWLVLVPTASALALLRESAPWESGWILLLFAFVWSADIGAYFAGRRFGRRRLASRVSPGKTWAGVLGGAAACLGIGIALAPAAAEVGARTWLLPALGVLVALVSVTGDLLESLVKRRAGVKDSGRLIPGHGGVLDRIDSLCAAAPVLALAVAGLFGEAASR